MAKLYKKMKIPNYIALYCYYFDRFVHIMLYFVEDNTEYVLKEISKMRDFADISINTNSFMYDHDTLNSYLLYARKFKDKAPDDVLIEIDKAEQVLKLRLQQRKVCKSLIFQMQKDNEISEALFEEMKNEENDYIDDEFELNNYDEYKEKINDLDKLIMQIKPDYRKIKAWITEYRK